MRSFSNSHSVHLLKSDRLAATWPLEFANCLLVGERRKRTTEVKVLQFLAEVRTMLIVVDEQTAPRAWRETLALARTYQLSVFDATYLELMSRRGLPLATLDGKQTQAACVKLGH